MCGIFAVLSAQGAAAAPSIDELIEQIKKLVRFDPNSGRPDTLLGTLEAMRNDSYRWVRPEGFLQIFRDGALRRRLEEATAGLETWLLGLERHLEGADALTQETREQINGLIVGGRDTAWQLKEDVLANLPKVRDLVPGTEQLQGAGAVPDDGAVPHAGGDDSQVWRHAWALNLILNNIDRLEVRGRDSAGVAAYVRFPSAAAAKAFLDRRGRRSELDRRSVSPAFTHLGVIAPPGSPETLLFAFKVAEEVGEMGQNVRYLRKAIAGDALFQAALLHPGVSVQAMGHTRWASNGVISLPNTHPVDSTFLQAEMIVPESHGAIVAALNGDIDNFQELHDRYVLSREKTAVDPAITTDAKIIPVVVEEHLKETNNLEAAFEAAFEEFEGSMAICLMAADRPGEFICAQKGSGQGLFIGFAGETVAVASEMYGLVELSQRYAKAEGEHADNGRTVGETFLVKTPKAGGVQRLPGRLPLEDHRITDAEITTRDINRGPYPRFLLKEISESVQSVMKTIRGKVFYDNATGEGRTLLDEAVLPGDLAADLKAGRIKRIIPMGQGTAAVAAQGIGHVLASLLKGTEMEVVPMKATELSGHYLQDDMSDALVVAVSQSGTTTDTNRTVDLVRERGARVIGIVNRRNSDLVYKSDSVLYTSDGRDIEMSVASTKAFYAQNVAGLILALALVEKLGLLSGEELGRKLKALLDLPAVMQQVLDRAPLIETVASETALKRRYWAVVGTGASKIAADEIRIKLSELCYKAIAVDYLEDKKHIDLSSEPLIIVCASGLPPATVSDEVKEVAIFKAHASLPIVIVDEDEERFDPYGAYKIPVPRYDGELGYLLPTMVGHLYGFYAASAFDREADRLKRLRLNLVRELEAEKSGGELGGTELWPLLARAEEITQGALEVQEVMNAGDLDSGLEVGTATRLSSLLEFLLGRIPLDSFTHRFGKPGNLGNLLASLVEQLSKAVNELCRPIDAIKHQAKTVTVGISRGADRPAEGPLWSAFRELGLDPVGMAASHGNILSALDPLTQQVLGATLYKVEGLSPIGKPLYTTTISIREKRGCAAGIVSRCETPRRLAGTKWGVVADNKVFLGRGQNDKRPILIVPLVGPDSEGALLLYHLELVKNGPRAARMAALRTLQDRYKQILISFTETSNREWDPAFVDKVDNDRLFFEDPRKLAALLA